MRILPCHHSLMSHDALFEIKEGALFITDAHYSAQRPQLLPFLKELCEEKISFSQLILMGDVFDMLFGPSRMLIEKNLEAIACINVIASKKEVLYLEGNHDFLLKSIFPDVRVVPLKQQPLECRYNSTTVYLAHGDCGTDFAYRAYTFVIRSRWVIQMLSIFDSMTSSAVNRWLDGYLSKKEDCKKFTGFEAFIEARLQKVYSDEEAIVIEGHYHQNRSVRTGHINYINLGAFACNQRYFIVESTDYEEFSLTEGTFKETG